MDENKDQGAETFVLTEQSLTLDREETNVAHRKMAAYTGTRLNPTSGCV